MVSRRHAIFHFSFLSDGIGGLKLASTSAIPFFLKVVRALLCLVHLLHLSQTRREASPLELGMLSHRPGMARADINATYAVRRWVVLEIEGARGGRQLQTRLSFVANFEHSRFTITVFSFYPSLILPISRARHRICIVRIRVRRIRIRTRTVPTPSNPKYGRTLYGRIPVYG